MLPAENAHHAYRLEKGQDDHTLPPVVEDPKAKGRRRSLWNQFLLDESGISQLDYDGLAEITGWSLELAPEALNRQAPDTGNMELFHLGTIASCTECWRPGAGRDPGYGRPRLSG